MTVWGSHRIQDDNGHLWRSDTKLGSFPSGFGTPVMALTAPNKNDLFEASNVYSVGGGKYLLVVECIGSNGRRYFRSWSATSLTGTWSTLAATQANPFAGTSNVVFPSGAWTQDISHGEAVRTTVDQSMTLSPCGMQYLYQGEAPNASGDYNTLPWKLALLTQTNC
jgi:endo-1,4-beta-xylanase